MAWFVGILIGLVVGSTVFAWWYSLRRGENRAMVEALESRSATAEGLLATTKDDLAATQGSLDESRAETESVRADLAERDADLSAARAGSNALREELAAVRDESEQFAEDATAQIGALGADLDAARSRGDGLQSDLDSATARITQLEATLALWETPDDLRQIKGIGSAFEVSLAGLGIHSYRSIAAIADEATTLIEQALHTFADRIVREEWRQQATALHEAKYGVAP